MTITPLRVENRLDAYKGGVRDRSRWPSGPWDSEPDLVEWRDEATGYPCLVVRGPMGALCGYVGVPPEHPWHGKEYGDTPFECEVHGGVTYSDKCAGHICHVPRPGESEHVWWFGFDCAHSGDVSPGLFALTGQIPRTDHGLWDETYKTMAYVQGETERLAGVVKGHESK
jgi:hypothetical protein